MHNANESPLIRHGITLKETANFAWSAIQDVKVLMSNMVTLTNVCWSSEVDCACDVNMSSFSDNKLSAVVHAVCDPTDMSLRIDFSMSDHSVIRVALHIQDHGETSFLSCVAYPMHTQDGERLVSHSHIVELSISIFNVADLSIRKYRNMRDFSHTFTSTFDQILQHVLHEIDDEIQRDRIRDMIIYNSIGGKQERAFLCYTSFIELSTQSDVHMHTNIELTACMWLVEILQAFATVEDDVMDDSLQRRGKPCWYRTVGRAEAINDGILLLMICGQLINKYVQSDVQRAIRELFDNVCFRTTIGQSLDLMLSATEKRTVTESQYNSMVVHKTAYYTFDLPLQLGNILARRPSSMYRDEIFTISKQLGYYFQFQDDYLDCYGEHTGKQGSDIQDGKCTWLVLYALTVASEVDAGRLNAHYGHPDPTCVSIVKNVYDAVDIPGEYNRREKKLVDEIKLSSSASSAPVQRICKLILGMLHKRYK